LKQVCKNRELHRPRRRWSFWTGAAPPPTKIDRRATADTMTSAQGSSSGGMNLQAHVGGCLR